MDTHHIINTWVSHNQCVDVCRVHGFAKPYVPSSREIADMILCRNRRLKDMTVFDFYFGTLTKSNTAEICGIRFTSGEPVEGKSRVGSDTKRCGSIFTAVMNGVSRYVGDMSVTRLSPSSRLTHTFPHDCHPFAFHSRIFAWLSPPHASLTHFCMAVTPSRLTHTFPRGCHPLAPHVSLTRFVPLPHSPLSNAADTHLHVRYGIIDTFLCTTLSWTDGFARVRWFHPPTYLHSSFLIVKIENRRDFDSSLPSIIDINDIDPSRVICEICEGNSMFVIRIEGYDTCALSNRCKCAY